MRSFERGNSHNIEEADSLRRNTIKRFVGGMAHMLAERQHSVIEKRRMDWMEGLVDRQIDQNVLNNSVLLIGPMGVGKTTIAKELQQTTGMERRAMDDRAKWPVERQRRELMRSRPEYHNDKDFEFYIAADTLTTMQQPMIVEFGGGQSVYEDPKMFAEMKKLVSQFSHVVQLLPSPDKNESLRIIDERVMQRPNASQKDLDLNRHFLTSPCNEELATTTVYTEGHSPSEVADKIRASL